MDSDNHTQTIETDVLIIGAGPAGMAAAMELAKAGIKFVILEKQNAVGGLSKTYSFDEDGEIFLTDNGPHRFFSKNPYLYSFIEDLLHEKWIKVKRSTRQYIDGKYYNYPIDALQALKNIGPLKALRMLIDLLYARIVYGLKIKKIITFEDYVVANFGRTLGQFNMINYTEKIWGIPASTIHTDWASQRIKGLSIRSIAANLIGQIFHLKKTDKPKTLVDEFYYPEKGTGMIYEAIANRLKEKGYRLFTGVFVTEISHKDKKIKGVAFKKEEIKYLVKFNHLIESMPLQEFLGSLSPAVPETMSTAVNKLAYRDQRYVFLTLNTESVSKDQWIYFPSKDIPFARISEMKNFSDLMSPPGKTSLFVEYFCSEGDTTWSMSDKALFDLTIFHLQKIGLVSPSDVRKYYVIQAKGVYPMYTLEYEKPLEEVKNYLDEFGNLFFIGRPGRFRYNNQDHSIEMGILAAESIQDGVKYDLESVGNEKEYYEKGHVPLQR